MFGLSVYSSGGLPNAPVVDESDVELSVVGCCGGSFASSCGVVWLDAGSLEDMVSASSVASSGTSSDRLEIVLSSCVPSGCCCRTCSKRASVSRTVSPGRRTGSVELSV